MFNDRSLKITFVILILLSCLSFPAHGRGQDVTLEFIGHATVLIQGKNITLVTDPFFGDRILGGLKRRIPPARKVKDLPPIDIILISHTHPDHCDMRAIKNIPGNPTLLIPWNRKKAFKNIKLPIIEMKPWEITQLESVKITAIPAKHTLGNCLGYLIEVDGISIYFTGDTKLFNDLEKLCNAVDVMLLPYGGTAFFGSIWTTSAAAKAVEIIKPDLCIPIHWGTFKRWWTFKEPETPCEFCDMVSKNSVKTRCKIMSVGEIIQLMN